MSHEGGRGMHANLALSISISKIHENSTLLQLVIYSSRNTQVELSLQYTVYRNEHRRNENLTTLSLSVITTKDEMYHI